MEKPEEYSRPACAAIRSVLVVVLRKETFVAQFVVLYALEEKK